MHHILLLNISMRNYSLFISSLYFSGWYFLRYLRNRISLCGSFSILSSPNILCPWWYLYFWCYFIKIALCPLLVIWRVVVVEKYLSRRNISCVWVICIDQKKIDEMVKTIGRLLNNSACTTGEAITIIEIVKTGWMMETVDQEMVAKYGLKKVVL